LGRVTVFIGENGCGKSNILEAIALGSAAAADKLDNEFLASRGIRVTDPKLMRSAFEKNETNSNIKVNFKILQNHSVGFEIKNNNKGIYSKWFSEITQKTISDPEILELAKRIIEATKQTNDFKKSSNSNILTPIPEAIRNEMMIKRENTKSILSPFNDLVRFRIFCPFIKFLLNETSLSPFGHYGEGLFDYIRHLSSENPAQFLEVKNKLELIDWFEDLEIPDNLYPGERTLKLKDRYLDPDLEYFDQKSTNEGFLFLLFYFCLFIGEETPKFFAIDNIDSSLNPRLCRRLIQELVELAKKYDKQVILTTHNPAVLDGLNLDDQEQKLYVINRKRSGHTRADQISSPKPLEGQELVPLSEAFLRGYIGGLPKNF
jgi:AAA15 family ATPase/GTPase